ncbi:MULTISPECIES: sodium:solute symporter family transporter [unclassified Carboxylicivirga]|uniref:sodium:solute symporter family transporter n=1 Tax=Carboxylicivirga TaxID=1628153 RepID=UPI003D353842
MIDGTYYDMLVVVLYFIIILSAGFLVSKKHSGDSASDYLTGGKELNWVKTGLTLIAMSIDTGIMGVAGIGFVWGLAIQPNAINLWIAAPLAAMFLIPIYWRSKIVTTPELLEKRFNVHSRSLFSVLMTLYNIIVLGTSIYLGGLILQTIFGWGLLWACLVIMGIVGLYVMLGGMKTVLTINIYQAVFITLTLMAVGIMSIYKVGGLSALWSASELSQAGNPMASSLLPFDLSPMSDMWYAMPAGLIWGALAGTAWIACNFGMVQRLLAAKDERHAQKAMLFTGAGHVFTFFFAYAVGVSINLLKPEIAKADESYVFAILNFFPVGIRGLLIAGLIASLISTIDGLLTSSGTLMTQDIYLRFFKPLAKDKAIKTFARVVQAIVLTIAFFIIPVAAKEQTVTRLIQDLVSIPLGVMIALYIMGVFSTKATPKAAFIGALAGTFVSFVIYFFASDINFLNRGIIGFSVVILTTVLISFFEKMPKGKSLENLTVHTLTGVKGPFVGLHAWPGLFKWIVGIIVAWFTLTFIWELMIRLS